MGSAQPGRCVRWQRPSPSLLEGRQHEDGGPLDPAVSRRWRLPYPTGHGRSRRHLELIPEEGVGLTSPAERDLIAKLELQRARLAEGGGTRRK